MTDPTPSTDEKPKPARRFRSCLGCTAVGVIFVILLIAGVMLNVQRLYVRDRSAAVATLLAAAPEPSRLDSATGSLGVVLNITDGSWIAIRYTDSHRAWAFYSCAVALCSDGTWLQSEVHHCGEFGEYRYIKQIMREAAPEHVAQHTDMVKDHPLNAIETAPDLAAAKLRLQQRGFTPYSPKGRRP